MTNIAACGDNCWSDQGDREERVHFDPDLPDSSVTEWGVRAARVATLGEMAGGIIHDFRNILAVVDSGLRLAEANSEEPAKARAFIAEARDGIERGRNLASQLLTFARMPELDRRACDINLLLRNLEEFLRLEVGSGIRIVLVLAPQLPICLVDQSQLSVAVLNLVLNARDAMPNGGEVQISTQAFEAEAAASDAPLRHAQVRIRVADSGIGMSSAGLAKIFDPFFTTKKETGTGLGLSQVSACLRLHGGHVSVSSGIGSGTAVDLFLPVSKAAISGGVGQSLHRHS